LLYSENEHLDEEFSNTNETNNVLRRNLGSFNLCIDPVEGDGDCAFTSIVMQLRKSKEWKDSDKKLFERLHEFGMGGSSEEDVYQLRQLFVNNVKSKDCYQQILAISPE